MGAEYQAADLRGPRTGQIVVTTTTGASQEIDLEHATLGFGTALANIIEGKFIRIICGTDMYYYWSGATGGTVDDTATGNGATVCDFLPANTPREEKPAGRYLVLKAAASKVRLSIVETQDTGGRV